MLSSEFTLEEIESAEDLMQQIQSSAPGCPDLD